MSFVKILIIFVAVIGIVYAIGQAPQTIEQLKQYQKTQQVKTVKKPLTTAKKPSSTAPAQTPTSQPKATTTPSKMILDIPDYRIQTGYKREELSPYFEKIQVSSVSTYSWGNYPKSISLYSYLQEGESINISGWKIKSNRSEISIPKAVGVYRPDGGEETDIILLGSNYINIYNAKSPVNKNFRLNKCTGYLENFYDFNPPLPMNCPYINRSEISYLYGECQSYIMSLSSCKMPETNFYNSLPGSERGNDCRAYLNTINFGNCYSKYRSDKDFLSSEWRIWIEGDWFIDSLHDRIRIFDKEDLLADEYIY